MTAYYHPAFCYKSYHKLFGNSTIPKFLYLQIKKIEEKLKKYHTFPPSRGLGSKQVFFDISEITHKAGSFFYINQYYRTVCCVFSVFTGQNGSPVKVLIIKSFQDVFQVLYIDFFLISFDRNSHILHLKNFFCCINYLLLCNLKSAVIFIRIINRFCG